MKIEKISENQLKIVLSRSDLSERNIDLIELVNGSDKTHELLKEMMEQALIEYDFQINNTPLVIEASPLSVDSLMLIITKIEEDKFDLDIDSGLNLLSEISKLSSFRKRSSFNATKRIKKKQEEPYILFSFNSLDDVINVSVRLNGIFTGASFLTKEQEKYFLMLTNDQEGDRPSIYALEALLSEYGDKHTANGLSEHCLKEHGEIIIAENATLKLAQFLGDPVNS